MKDQKTMKTKGPDAVSPESRLYWLLYLAPLEVGWTALRTYAEMLTCVLISVSASLALPGRVLVLLRYIG